MGTIRTPAQDKKLTARDIGLPIAHGMHPHRLKPYSRYDPFKDKNGNVFVKPHGGVGPGDWTEGNLNDLED
jgi:hypothetical protein